MSIAPRLSLEQVANFFANVNPRFTKILFCPLKWICYTAGLILGTEGTLVGTDEDESTIILDYDDREPGYRDLLFNPVGQVNPVDLLGPDQ